MPAKKTTTKKKSTKKAVSKKTASKKATKKTVKKSTRTKKETPYVVPDHLKTHSEIEKVMRLEQLHREHLHIHQPADSVAYWTFLFLVLFMNFINSFILVFLMITLVNTLVYVVVGIFGVTFGYMYERLLHGLRRTDPFHHIFAKFFLVATGGISAYFAYVLAKFFRETIGLSFDTPFFLTAALVYFVAYLLPYAFARFLFKK